VQSSTSPLPSRKRRFTPSRVIVRHVPSGEVTSPPRPEKHIIAKLEHAAPAFEERSEIERLLTLIRRLPPDTKIERLRETIGQLQDQGYEQVMVFTQFTDTMDFLRSELGREPDQAVWALRITARDRHSDRCWGWGEPLSVTMDGAVDRPGRRWSGLMKPAIVREGQNDTLV